MNRSKILGASALASLMAAGAAQAEMSVSGYACAFADSDGGGLSNSTHLKLLQYRLTTR